MLKRSLALLLALSLVWGAASADRAEDEATIAAQSTEMLLYTRDLIDAELARRAGTEEAQTVTVDGVVFRLLSAEIGEARDGLPGLLVILLASNTSDKSFTPRYDLGDTATQGGIPMGTSWVRTENHDSGTVSTSATSVIRPGAVDMMVFLGYQLPGDSDRVELTLSRKHTTYREDPYCGTFVIDLAALRSPD